MATAPIKEKCPKCGKEHTRGEYELNQNTTPHCYQPRDVKCDCGLTLHWSVPLFKMNQSGYVLRILRDDEVPFL